MDVEDFSCGTLKFENGANVSFKVAWAANMPESSDIRLVGDRAGIDLPSGKIYFGEDGEEILKTEKLIYNSPFAGHIYIADNLRKVIKGEAEPIVKPEETINTVSYTHLDGYKRQEEYAYDMQMYKNLLNKTVETLSHAKKLHDDLEKFYIPNMNFKKIMSLCEKTIKQILEMA